MKAHDYPLETAKLISDLLKEVKSIYSSNSNIVEIVEKEDVLMYLKDRESDFFFEITEMKYTVNDKIFYRFQVNPWYDDKIETANDIKSGSYILKILAAWIQRVKTYHEIDWSGNHNVDEKDNYIHFEEVTVEPLTIEQIDTALTFLKNSLEKNATKYPVEHLIRDVTILQKHLADLPEKVIKKMGRDIVQEIADLGKDAVKDIIKDPLKDFIKYIFLGEGVRQLFNHIQHLLQ